MFLDHLYAAVIESLPVLILGFLFLFVGLLLKLRATREKNVYTARVLDLRDECQRDEHGYLTTRAYSLTADYFINGQLRTVTFRADYEYPIGSQIQIKLAAGGARVLSKVPLDGTSNPKIGSFRGYRMFLVAGQFILLATLLMVFTELSQTYAWASLVAGCIPGILLLWFGLKRNRKNELLLQDIENGIYRQAQATVVDIRKEISASDNGSRYRLYPILSYPVSYGTGTQRREVRVTISPQDVKVGDSIPVYVHRSGDVKLPAELKYIQVPGYIMIAVGCLIFFFTILSLF